MRGHGHECAGAPTRIDAGPGPRHAGRLVDFRRPGRRHERGSAVHVVVAHMLSTALVLIVLATLGERMMASFTDVTTSWDVLQQRADSRADTRIAGPVGLSVSATSTVEITLVNEGDSALALFADWDVLFEVQESPGLAIAYLTYTTSTSPSTNQWAVRGDLPQRGVLDSGDGRPGDLQPGRGDGGRGEPVAVGPERHTRPGQLRHPQRIDRQGHLQGGGVGEPPL